MSLYKCVCVYGNMSEFCVYVCICVCVYVCHNQRKCETNGKLDMRQVQAQCKESYKTESSSSQQSIITIKENIMTDCEREKKV